MANATSVFHEKQILVLDEIQDALECVICLDVPKHDPIYQCDNGHILCEYCHKSVFECPVCKLKLGSTRNLAVEKVLEKCPRPCDYNNFGCSIRLTRAALDVHQEVCIHKPLKCPLQTCGNLVTMSEIVNHINKDHDVLKVHQSKFVYKITSESIRQHGSTLRLIQIHFNGRYFISVFLRSSFDKRWYIPWHIP